MIELSTGGHIQSGQFRRYSQMRIRSGLLYRGRRIVVPKSCREAVLRRVHSPTHAGVQRTYEDLRESFFWRGMFLDTQNFCRCCEICLRNKRSYGRKEPLKPIKLAYNFPRALIAMDIAYLPWSSTGYVLIVVDLFSKYMEAIPMKNQEASTVVEALEYGCFTGMGTLWLSFLISVQTLMAS